MLEVDFHTHSSFSRCGIHSVVEMLVRAKSLGMKGVAITDHGPELKSRVNSTFYERLIDPVPGIRLLKGMECNLIGDTPRIDLPLSWARFMDLVLVGIHFPTPRGLGRDTYTGLMIEMLQSNPWVDIITHPDDIAYPLDFARLADAAAARGVALELNNSKTALRRTEPAVTRDMLRACVAARCPVAVSSDAHALNEVGADDAVAGFLREEQVPEELVVNRDGPAAFAFVERRRAAKLSAEAEE